MRLRSPLEARAQGVGMVFQHFSLFDNLTVAENIALVLPKQAPLSGLRESIHAVSTRYNMPLEPDREVWTLSAGERQRIEIARCLLQDPKLIILDEPTSVLTPQEATSLFETLERLKAEGRALLYISHKLEEVRRLCDRATILRLGRKVGDCDPRQERARALAQNVIKTFDVRKAGPDPAARTLSGGNLQKFVVGREILSEPGVLVINQPTWGVDAAAAATIRQALLDLAARGAAVLLISQDLDELFEICDRIAVMREGRLSAALETGGLTREDVGLLMAGAAPGDSAHAH